MNPTVTRQWLIAGLPTGRAVRASDFSMTETPLPEMGPGDLLVRVLYLGFAPSQKVQMDNAAPYAPPIKVGDPMRGGGIAQVIQSNSDDFRPGDVVTGMFGWVEYAVIPAAGYGAGLGSFGRPNRVEASVPLTANLSVISGNGYTAYFGLLDVGRPVPGDTVVVSGAAGGVGSIVGQIAKIAGCRVIGIAGGPEKCAWLKEIGFDVAIDHRAGNVAAQLKEACPNGLNVFFDNVGGELLDIALSQMAPRARIVICGGISRYESAPGQMPPGPSNYFELINKAATMEGFLVLQFLDRIPEAKARLVEWVKERRIVSREDVLDGFENAPQGLIRLFESKNIGQQVLKVAAPFGKFPPLREVKP